MKVLSKNLNPIYGLMSIVTIQLILFLSVVWHFPISLLGGLTLLIMVAQYQFYKTLQCKQKKIFMHASTFESALSHIDKAYLIADNFHRTAFESQFLIKNKNDIFLHDKINIITLLIEGLFKHTDLNTDLLEENALKFVNSLKSTYETKLKFNQKNYDVALTPLYNNQGVRLGTLVQFKNLLDNLDNVNQDIDKLYSFVSQIKIKQNKNNITLIYPEAKEIKSAEILQIINKIMKFNSIINQSLSNYFQDKSTHVSTFENNKIKIDDKIKLKSKKQIYEMS